MRQTTAGIIVFLVLVLLPMGAATFATTLPYTSTSGDSSGQKFYGDGAIINNTTGAYVAPSFNPPAFVNGKSTTNACLQCHQAQPFTLPNGQTVSAPDMRSYLRTGHKNMLRKAGGFAWSTPGAMTDGTTTYIWDNSYASEEAANKNSYGNLFLWSTQTGTIGDQISVGSLSSLSTGCGFTNSVWSCSDVNKALYYIFGGWAGDYDYRPADVYDQGFGACVVGNYVDPRANSASQCTGIGGSWSTTRQPLNVYPCARCHTTGYSADASLNTAKGPEADYPGISWNGLDEASGGSGKISFKPNVADQTCATYNGTDSHGYPICAALKSTATSASTAYAVVLPQTYASWVVEGIQCERCHSATLHAASSNFTVTRATWQVGLDGNGLCLQCHRQEAPYQAPYNFQTPGINIVMGKHDMPLKDVNSYTPGNQFLNSPHARFMGQLGTTGTGDLTDPAQYNTQFMDTQYVDNTGSNYVEGSCISCHNVHETTNALADPSAGESAMYNTCVDCHTTIGANSPTANFANPSAPLINPVTIGHPGGPGTPLATYQTDLAQVCVTCHMPPAGTTGSTQHLFRISTDPSYSTWPNFADWSDGKCTDPNVTLYKDCKGTYSDGVNAYTQRVWLPDPSNPNYPNNQLLKKAPEYNSDGSVKFANAIWIDLNDACGQCHGGGTANVTATGNAAAGSGVITLTSTTNAAAAGFAPDQRIYISGAGRTWGNGVADPLETHIASVSGNTITVIDYPQTTVTAATVIQNATKNNAPYIAKSGLGGVAAAIHSAGAPYASFTYTDDATTGDLVHFNASQSLCPAGDNCVYMWIFGDGNTANASSSAYNYQYSAAGSYNVTLTLLDTTSQSKSTTTESVTAVKINVPPVASFTYSVAGYIVTVTDTSTEGNNGPVTGTVSWGDNATSTVAEHGQVSHTYSSQNTFVIKYTVTDGVSTSQAPSQRVTISGDTISGYVTRLNGTPVGGAMIMLYNSVTNKRVGSATYSSTNGSYSFGGIASGSYYLVTTASGLTFNNVNVTLTTSNVTQNIVSTN
jgi:predicted CXXCH cytochrome family protein